MQPRRSTTSGAVSDQVTDTGLQKTGWSLDPRWVAIIATVCLTLWLQYMNRKHANQQFRLAPIRDAEEDEFLKTVRDPLYDALNVLRKFRLELRIAAQQADPRARKERIVAITEGSSVIALGELMEALVGIELQLATEGGEWVQICADLEEALFVQLARLEDEALPAVDVEKSRYLANAAINVAIFGSQKRIKDHRQSILRSL